MRTGKLFLVLAASTALFWSGVAVMAAGPAETGGSHAKMGTGGALATETPMKEGMTANTGVIRVADIVGLAVKNKDDVTLGKIEDLVLDRQTGNVRFLAVGSGGLMGFGERLTVVPWGAISLHKGSNQNIDLVRLDISQERFKDAPVFQWSKLHDLADARFVGSIESFYSKTSTAGRSSTEKR